MGGRSVVVLTGKVVLIISLHWVGVGGWERRRTDSGRIRRWGTYRVVRVFDDRVPRLNLLCYRA